VQNVTNPAASIALLRAGSADAALTWEPNVSAGIAADPDLQVIFNAGEVYKTKTGLPLPYFSVAVRDELIKRDPQMTGRVAGAFKDCVDGIMGNVAEAVAVVGQRTGFAPAVLQDAIGSGRLKFVFASMASADERKNVRTAGEFFTRNELLPKPPDDGFFAG
jgi:NitT/TauT family transport system substrate-binding protein